ncbi:MAG: hypothetical protein GC165_05120 [Armatimonadetes bacterium]|nr:hypothetical protein [Armatimonadota bacterium]
MIIAGKSIQFWALIVWFALTCLGTACKRNDQGMYRRRKIPNLVYWITSIGQWVCLGILGFYVQWFTPILVYFGGFVLASIGISDFLGNFFVQALFPKSDDPPIKNIFGNRS